MPNTRRKACQQCRSAKARCSLASPCSRCVDRRLPCHYPTLRFRYRNNLRPSTQQYTHDASFHHLSDNIANATSSGDLLRPTELIDWNEVEGNSGLLNSTLVDTNLNSSHENEASGALQASPLLWDSSIPNSLSGFLPALNPNDTSINGALFRIDTSSANLRSISPHSSSLTRGTFEPRNNVLKHSSTTTTAAKTLTHQILRGQIKGYPEMMFRVNLPHFIHPQCVLRDQSVQDCISDAGIHSCLPEPLAICASLMHMFFTKTDASSAFVKGKIYEEHCRLHREHLAYDVETLLAAFQASFIYIIVQGEGTSSLICNKQHGGVVHSMLKTCGEIGKQLYRLSDYESPLELSHDVRQVRLNWVLKESIKRSYCLLYGIELLSGIAVATTETRRTECLYGYTRVPLPSSRDLWSSASNQEWAKQYKRFFGKKSQESVLRMQDLMPSLQASIVGDGKAANLESHKDISEWCERLDEFGMLICMATMVEQGL